MTSSSSRGARLLQQLAAASRQAAAQLAQQQQQKQQQLHSAGVRTMLVGQPLRLSQPLRQQLRQQLLQQQLLQRQLTQQPLPQPQQQLRVLCTRSSGWQAQLQAQLSGGGGSISVASSSRQLWRPQQARSALSSAGRRAYSAAAAGARSGGGAAAAAAGWWDSWALWVGESSGLLLSSMLNALNTVGGKLPVALGLLLVDMAHASPLLGGSRADSLEAPYLPDSLPASGFYAQGGHAGAAQAAEQQGSSSSSKAGLWGGAGAAAAEAGSALSAGARLVWLGCIWLPALLTAPLALHWHIGRDWWLVLLRLSLEASGPAFIKWGQWAATRHDLFAADVCAALEQLHTNAPAHSFRYTCNALSKSFGLRPSELFDWIEDAPIACGSIGQVHRGRLSAKGAALTGCSPGDTVAIKVRHPGVSAAIERDFETMVWLAHLAGQLVPAARALRLDETLKQFAAPLHEQVDLSREAANLKRFNKNFKRAKAVSFPMPLYPLVSPDVLVESFEPGRHISHYIAADRGSHPYRVRLAELGSGTMLQMMLVDNLIHSDLHPGNILVRLEPPHGLLGLAYKAVACLANPEGPAMRALARTLSALPLPPQQQQQDGTGTGTGSSSSSSSSSSGSAEAVGALTPAGQPSSPGDDGSGGETGLLQRWLGRLCDAAGGPKAVLRKVQTSLRGVAVGWLQPHIVLLDVGMATELSPEDQANMVGLFRSFAALDGESVARWTLRFSGDEQACEDPGAFIDDMQATFETLKKTIAAHQAAEARWKQQHDAQLAAAAAVEQAAAAEQKPRGGGGGGGALLEMPEEFDSGAEALATVLELVRLHSVSLPGHICAVVVTTLILEGWSNKLAPEHSVLNQVKGMFAPSMYTWHDRMDTVVDLVMDRGDTALSLA